MAYIKLDDRYPDHPKVVAAGPDAAYLYVCGLCYCNRYLTDGFIPSEIVPRLAPFDEAKSQQLATTLVSVCLWHVSSKNGFDVHDYLKHQSSREDILNLRAIRKEAGKLGGLARGLARGLAKGKQKASKSLAKEEGRRKKEETNSIIPEWIEMTAWEHFLDMRRTLKASPTKPAIALLIKKLGELRDAGQDPNEILEQSTMNNWKGLFPLKVSQRSLDGNNARQPTVTPPQVSADFDKYT